jgi:uncharacterized protein (DUF342 family)
LYIRTEILCFFSIYPIFIEETMEEIEASGEERAIAGDTPLPEDQTNRVMLLSGDRNDGNVSVLFAEDQLEVSADFYPPMGNGKPLSAEYITSALERLNVVHGIIWESIQDAVVNCNLNHKILKNITIARGNPPVKEVAEYFEINPALNAPPQEPTDNARIDYKAFSPFMIVKKGQALARLRPRREGKDGKDIHGNAIPHGTIKPEGVSGGTNTRPDGKFIYAEINGQMVQDRGILNVQNFLVIKGAVDYRTGHIVFPGDVEIDGPVSDGFKIYSGGSITIKQTFDVTDSVSKGDLNVSGGIIGRGRALVKVGGELRAKFIENCTIACRNRITVDTGIVNSSVYTMDKIEMSERGKILGGEIYAVQGISAGSIGKKSGKATRIHCGVNFTAQQEKEKCNYRLRILSAKLGKLRELITIEQGAGQGAGQAGVGQAPEANPRLAKMEELLKRLEEEQKKTAARITAILGKINSDENAVVEVQGEIAPGTLIEICQIALFVSEPLKHVRVRLDRGLGKLVSEPL